MSVRTAQQQTITSLLHIMLLHLTVERHTAAVSEGWRCEWWVGVKQRTDEMSSIGGEQAKRYLYPDWLEGSLKLFEQIWFCRIHDHTLLQLMYITPFTRWAFSSGKPRDLRECTVTVNADMSYIQCVHALINNKAVKQAGKILAIQTVNEATKLLSQQDSWEGSNVCLLLFIFFQKCSHKHYTLTGHFIRYTCSIAW